MTVSSTSAEINKMTKIESLDAFATLFERKFNLEVDNPITDTFSSFCR
jgi:hypothetical protein